MSAQLRGALTLALVLGLGAGAARAQAPGQPERLEGVTLLTDTQFTQLPPSTPDGERFSIVWVKFTKLFGDQLKMHQSPLGDRLLVRDGALRGLLNANQDSEQQRLTPRRSNVQVVGVGQRNPQGVYQLVVTRVRLLESDPEQFKRRAEALPKGDAAKRLELARALQARLRRYYTGGVDHDAQERRELVQLLRQLEEEARAIELAQLPPLPEGAEARLRAGERLKALGVVAQVWADDRVPADLRREAERILAEVLGARLYLGRWYALEDFKDLLNFERQADGRWIPRERAEFVRICDDERRRIQQGESVQVLPAALLRQATEVVKGMNKDMVLAMTRGYPARVDRVREQVGATTLTWELWVMDDGLRIYFVNGTVFRKDDPAADGAGGGE